MGHGQYQDLAKGKNSAVLAPYHKWEWYCQDEIK
jgi:hypothetical protein